MKRVKYSGNRPEYIDGFPKDCERSCKGAIHLLPNAIREITDGEYDYIKKSFPKLRLQVLPKEKPAVKKVRKVKASAPSQAVKFHKEQKKEAAKSEGSASKKLSSRKKKT